MRCNGMSLAILIPALCFAMATASADTVGNMPLSPQSSTGGQPLQNMPMPESQGSPPATGGAMGTTPSAPQVSRQEAADFAAAVKAIGPLNARLRKEMAKAGNTSAHQTLLEQYRVEVQKILQTHHLTAQRYSALLDEARTNPQFAAEVEKMMGG